MSYHLSRVLAVVLAGLLVIFAFGALDLSKFAPRPSVAPSDPTAPVPAFKHIFVIVFENKEYEEVIDSRRTPYLTSLAGQFGLAKNFYGTTHPSLPNYLALIGGDTFGVSSNCTNCWLNQPNLVDQFEQAGISWKAYMEAMPEPCHVGDAGKLYRQKHNPFIYFNDIRNNPERCNKIVPFEQFSSDLKANALPQFVWITPNMCNAGHDCKADASDAWLKQWVSAIMDSPEWKDQGALFITFDEGSSNAGCCRYAQGGRIATLVISPLGKPSFTSEVAYSHYSLLRTIEAAWSLPPIGKADCDCSPTMADFFTAK